MNEWSISLPADLNVTFFGNLTIAGQEKNGNFCQILVANPEITLNTDGVIEIYQPSIILSAKVHIILKGGI